MKRSGKERRYLHVRKFLAQGAINLPLIWRTRRRVHRSEAVRRGGESWRMNQDWNSKSLNLEHLASPTLGHVAALIWGQLWRSHEKWMNIYVLSTAQGHSWMDVNVLWAAQLVSYLVLWAQSTTNDYIRAEHKLHFVSKLFSSQVIIPQVMFCEPIYIPRALDTGTCLRQGDLFYSAGLHRNRVSENQENRERFWTKCRWMDRKSRNKQGRIPGSKRNMYGYVLTYSRL